MFGSFFMDQKHCHTIQKALLFNCFNRFKPMRMGLGADLENKDFLFKQMASKIRFAAIFPKKAIFR